LTSAGGYFKGRKPFLSRRQQPQSAEWMCFHVARACSISCRCLAAHLPVVYRFIGSSGVFVVRQEPMSSAPRWLPILCSYTPKMAARVLPVLTRYSFCSQSGTTHPRSLAVPLTGCLTNTVQYQDIVNCVYNLLTSIARPIYDLLVS